MGGNYKYRTYSSHGSYGTNCLLSAVLNYIAMIPVGILMGIIYIIGKISEPIFGSDFVKEKKIISVEPLKEDSMVEECIKKEDNPQKILLPSKIIFKKSLRCPLCSNPMILRNGPYGKFYGCSMYPKCKGISKIRSKK